MTNSLGHEQYRLRFRAAEELRAARAARAGILNYPHSNPEERAQANADWYAAIRKAARDGILTPAQIQETALLSRQRYWQITRVPAPPPTTTVQLPPTDLSGGTDV